MKKIIISAISLILTVFCLFSCSGGDGTPEGMQKAQGSDELGYYFYVPEEWVVSNHGEISAAYASKVDSSSVSYVETDAPSVSEEETISLATRRAAATDAYFKGSMEALPSGYILVIDGEAITFGNAEHAFKYVIDFEYQEHKFRMMQTFVYFEGRFGIFTFNSPNEHMSSDEKVQFDYYSEKMQNIIDNFKFVTKLDGVQKEDTREADADGYLLSSNKNTAGLSLYLPPEFKLEFSSGMVGASLPDGSNLTVSKATSTGVSVDDYWNYRKSELEALFGSVTVLSKNPDSEENSAGVPIDFEGAKYAFAYEYTYNALGETYHVYQVLAVEGTDGFVFTYTAKEANYLTHLDTINNIFKKVEF